MKTKTLLTFISFLLVCHVTQAQTIQLYGMASGGGAHDNCGTIVKMNTDGTGFTKVYDFIGATGSHPLGNPIQAANGKLYGVCEDGGTDSSCVIFSFDPTTGNYIDLYNFFDSTGDVPMSGLIQEPNGTFIGVATGGGYGTGVIYSFNPSNNIYSDLHFFGNGYSFLDTIIEFPIGTPTLSTDGKLYGMLSDGWWYNDSLINYGNGNGAIYSFDLSSNVYTDLYDFTSIVSGANPIGSLIELNGKLYGMATSGGANNYGTLFSLEKITKKFTVLHNFDNTGANPVGALFQASNGLFYGTTFYGGAHSKGTLFSFDVTNNTYKDIFDFSGTNGANPEGSLVQSVDGKLYGTTYNGGNFNMGTAFSIDPTNNFYTVVAQFDSSNGAHPAASFGTYNSALAGISTIGKAEQLTVYPIPATKFVSCHLQLPADGKAELTLTNIRGQKVLTRQMEVVSTKADYPIDITTLDAGVYFAELKLGDKKYSGKVIKE